MMRVICLRASLTFTTVAAHVLVFSSVAAAVPRSWDANGANPANLLGWALFGPGVGNMNTNILPTIGTGAGSQGFTPPLTGSDYTFWIQQTGDPCTYHLNFVVVPEPATTFAGAGLAGLLLRRKKASQENR